MDIQYLLMLQNLRSATGCMVPFLDRLCDLNLLLLPALCVFLYLAVEKRIGYLALMSFHTGELDNL